MAKIRNTDYLSLSARVHAMEVSLLSRERMERMLEARTDEEAVKVLTECGYAELNQVTPEGVDRILAGRRETLLRELEGARPDPRFLEVKDRVANHAAMREEISPWTQQHTIDEVDKLLNDAGCPACPVNTIDRLVVDPLIAGARCIFPTINQPGIGELAITAIPQHLTRTSSQPRKPAPLLGEDNAAVYGQMLGLDEAKLAELKEKGVI